MDWEEVQPKKKVKKQCVKPAEEKDPMYLGGGSGPWYMSQGGGQASPPGTGPKPKKKASQDYDEEEKDEAMDVEMVSHKCALGVRQARQAKGWSQQELAKAMNTKVSVVVEIEKGEAIYNPEQINLIARVTG